MLKLKTQLDVVKYGTWLQDACPVAGSGDL